VNIEDVEAATVIRQHLGQPRVADDGIDNQRVLVWVGDAVRVILTAEGYGLLQPIKEGRRGLLGGEDLMSLAFALVARHVHRQPPPKMRKTFSKVGKPPMPPSPPSFLASFSFATMRL
jgi:hypothetical protein